MSKFIQLIIAVLIAVMIFGKTDTVYANSKVTIDLNGEVIKTAQISNSESSRTIVVSGIFGIEYIPSIDRHVFTNLKDISTQLFSLVGTWKQIDYQASLIDGGTTYNLSIKGIYTINGESFEEEISVEFYCNDAIGQTF